MSANPYTVGIAGLTSKLAMLMARSVLQKPNTAIRGLVRNPAKLPQELAANKRVTIVQGDAFDKEAANKFTQGCNAVICGYLGSHDVMIDGQKILVDACEANGVPRYFPSDYTIDYDKLEMGQLPNKDPMKVVKGYIEDRRAQGAKTRGVYVLIGGFMDTLFSSFFNLYKRSENKLQAWGSMDDPVWDMTSYQNTAEYVGELAVDENAVGPKKCESHAVLPGIVAF